MRTIFGFAASAVVALAATANAAVTSTFTADSENWFDTGSSPPGWSNELGYDGLPGVLAQTSINAPSFPDINAPTTGGSLWMGDWQNHAGPDVGGNNLKLSIDTKWVNGDYAGLELRIYTDTGPNTTIWKKLVGNAAVGVNQWDHIEVLLNTEWSDAQATSNGWALHQGPHTFTDTLANVNVFRIYTSNIVPNLTQLRYDNIGLTAPVPIPEPASFGLLTMGGVLAARRRRA